MVPYSIHSVSISLNSVCFSESLLSTKVGYFPKILPEIRKVANFLKILKVAGIVFKVLQ